jgi:hypothetical protein
MGGILTVFIAVTVGQQSMSLNVEQGMTGNGVQQMMSLNQQQALY